MNSFDLDPDINWPTPEEFQLIRRLQEENLITETCPSPRAWHFNVNDQAAWNLLPAVCRELVH